MSTILLDHTACTIRCWVALLPFRGSMNPTLAGWKRPSRRARRATRSHRIDSWEIPWRRERESNPPTRICNPVHNRFAIAPRPSADWRYGLLGVARVPCGRSGAGKESRTLDLYLGKVSLYQLSYSRLQRTRIIKACPRLSTHSSRRATAGDGGPSGRRAAASAADPPRSGAARPSACNSPSTTR